MRPDNLRTKIFLDGGDPKETEELMKLIGFVDGQTTNPTLISRNPEAKQRMAKGEKFTEAELLRFYEGVVKDVSGRIPHGSVSIEVYADSSTESGQMIEQGREMFSWIPNAHIKFPTTTEGLKAAEQAVKEGMRVNMTLCFTQDQAAAVYAATQGAKKGDVFVSPFVGRLDDRGENGMDLIAHIMKMYTAGDSHVEVLTASVRTYDHMLYALQLGSDIITAPFKVLKQWGESGMPVPAADYTYQSGSLKQISYKEMDLSEDWKKFDITHELTDIGIEKFSADWNNLVKR